MNYLLYSKLRLATEHNLTPLRINTDSMKVTKMLHAGHLPYNPIISECRSLMDQLGNPVINHSFRKQQNQVADFLAKEGANRKFFDKTWILVVRPMFAIDAI